MSAGVNNSPVLVLLIMGVFQVLSQYLSRTILLVSSFRAYITWEVHHVTTSQSHSEALKLNVER
jgi:hypothetical protein